MGPLMVLVHSLFMQIFYFSEIFMLVSHNFAHHIRHILYFEILTFSLCNVFYVH